MTEYEGVPPLLSSLTGLHEGIRPYPASLDGVSPLAGLYSTDTRIRTPDVLVIPWDGRGERDGWRPNDNGDLLLTRLYPPITYQGVRPGVNRGMGVCLLFEGMFSDRDKLARIGVVCTITGVPLGNTDVILNGINHREIVKTDERGVWWKYLEIDEYPDALFISSNGIVYALLEQKERVGNEGIFDQVVQRRTIANATSRQLHRKFV